MNKKQFFPNRLPNRDGSQYKAVIKFNETSSREGTTEYSYDTPGDDKRGLDKLKRFVEKVHLNGQLKIAIIYNNQTGVQMAEFSNGKWCK